LVVLPVLGERAVLTQVEWASLATKFAALESWLAAKPASRVEPLGIARLDELLQGTQRADLEQLIAQDVALAAEMNAITDVDKLVHYCRDLHTLVNNFVSFQNFYTGTSKAIFQAGTLYLDGRSCELCVQVADVGKHAGLANLSRVCLVYCECTRNGGSEKMFIAAAFTAGDSDHLTVARNGVFYDRKGQDWDASIVRILEHPISIRQAFWSPYKCATKMIGEQIQKIAAAKSAAAEDKMLKGAMSVNLKPEVSKAPPTPFDVGKFAGVFAAIGLAVGALGTALVSLLTGLFSLAWWQFPFAIAGIILVISGPAILIAWLKLRQRNLGPILDANGWAVNARAKINIPFGSSLTGLAVLPEGATRQLSDPFAEKQSKLPYVLLVILVLSAALWCAWHFGWVKI
jgi:hypothetical protein